MMEQGTANKVQFGTILRPAGHDRHKRAGKLLQKVEHGYLKTTAQYISHWTFEPIHAQSLEEALNALKHSLTPGTAFIRGSLDPSVDSAPAHDKRRGLRRISKEGGQHPRTVADTPSNLLVLDIDRVCPALFGPHAPLDVTKPHQSVSRLLTWLKNSSTFKRAFGDISAGYRLSSTAGLTTDSNGLYTKDSSHFRVHLYFWLQTPQPELPLRSLLHTINSELRAHALHHGLTHQPGSIDASVVGAGHLVFGPPHVVDSRARTVADPIPQRIGIIHRANNTSTWTPTTTTAPQRSEPAHDHKHHRLLKKTSKGRGLYLNQRSLDIHRENFQRDVNEVRGAAVGSRGLTLQLKIQRWTWRFANEDAAQALGSLATSLNQLTQAADDNGVAQNDINRRLKLGNTTAYQSPSKGLRWVHTPPGAPRPKSASNLVSKSRALSQISAIRRAVKEGTLNTTIDILDQHGPGSGKTTSLRTTAVSFQNADKRLVQVIVAKDRRAAFAHEAHFKAAGVPCVAFVGRRRFDDQPNADILTHSWRPGRSIDGDIETCNSRLYGKGVNIKCGQPNAPGACTYLTNCQQSNGFISRWYSAQHILNNGGVIVVVSQTLQPIINKHNQLATKGTAAPWRYLWVDDAPPQSPREIRLDDLRTGFKELRLQLRRNHKARAFDTNVAIAQLTAMVDDIESAFNEQSQPTHTIGKTVIERVLNGHLTKAAAAPYAHLIDLILPTTKAAGVSCALAPFLQFLIHGQPNKAHLIEDRHGLRLRIFPDPFTLPQHVRVWWGDATVDPAIAESIVGRKLTTLKSTEPRHNTHTYKRFESALIRVAHTHDVPTLRHKAQLFTKGIKTTLDDLHSKLNRPLKTLVIAPKALIGSLHLQAILQDSGCPNADLIHWRGILQKGSNAFQHHDAVILLGDPRPNITAHKATLQSAASDRLAAGLPNARFYTPDEAAVGVLIQGAGRGRFAIRPQKHLALIHVGTLNAFDAQVIDARLKGGTTQGSSTQHWMLHHGLKAISRKSPLFHPDALPPSDSTLRRFCKQQVEDGTWKKFLVSTTNPHTNHTSTSHWFGPNKQAVLDALLLASKHPSFRGHYRGGISVSEALSDDNPVNTVTDGLPGWSNGLIIYRTKRPLEHPPKTPSQDAPTHPAKTAVVDDSKTPDSPYVVAPKREERPTDFPAKVDESPLVEEKQHEQGTELERWVEDVGVGVLPGVRITLGPSTLHIGRLLERLEPMRAMTLRATLMFYGRRRRWSWLELSEHVGMSVPELKERSRPTVRVDCCEADQVDEHGLVKVSSVEREGEPSRERWRGGCCEQEPLDCVIEGVGGSEKKISLKKVYRKGQKSSENFSP